MRDEREHKRIGKGFRTSMGGEHKERQCMILLGADTGHDKGGIGVNKEVGGQN